MGIIQELERQARKRKRDWAMLRIAGYKLEPIYKKWYQGDFSQRHYIRYDGSLKQWCYSGDPGHKILCKALNQEYTEDDD